MLAFQALASGLQHGWEARRAQASLVLRVSKAHACHFVPRLTTVLEAIADD
jgi:hypothetical protein